MNDNLQSGFRIGDWDVYPQENLLKCPNREHVLEPKVMDVLVFLAATDGAVVSRQQLLDSVWVGVVVGDETLSRAVSVLRAALGDDLKSPRYLQTISKRGYRLIADVIPIASKRLQEAEPVFGSSRANSAQHASESSYGPKSRMHHLATNGLIVIAVIGLVLYFFVFETAPPTNVTGADNIAAPRVGKIMLAVLPLDNLSSDPDQEFFSDGLTEEMISQLGSLQRDRLGVIARTSVMYYKGKNKRIDEIGRELNVDYVLEGSVRRAGKRVRITAQLIQVSDQTHLWAQSFERDLDDIFSLQLDIAQRVTRTLALELLPTQREQLQRNSLVNAAAYEAYLKGRYYETRGGRNGYMRAVEHYDEAINTDPEYALAYANIGHTYGMRGASGYIPIDEANQMFWDYNLKAAELDPGLAEVEVNFADFKFYQDWEWSEGEAGFRRAYEKDPGSESVVWHYALCLHILGRFDEAIEVLERSLVLNPHSRQLNRALVSTFLNSRQNERAIQQYQKLIELQPNDSSIYNSLGNVFGELGRYGDAMEAYLKARNLAGDSSDQVQALRDAYSANGMRGFWGKRVEHLIAERGEVPLVRFAGIYAGLGEKHQALAWIREAEQRKDIAPLTLARIYALLGERDQAITLLEKAVEDPTPMLPWINVDRRWDLLRDDPRFQDMVRRMNFPG